MGATFGFMETLGFLSLAGIIINNAIVLLDRIEIELAQGRAPYDAVIQAGVMRLRPILMTTLTTILGLVPLILFGGDLWFGMANAIAWGLGVGTVMTLGVVPVLYAVLFHVKAPAQPITSVGVSA
jgi:multidrug efflux pump subunit AcrB